MRTLLVATVLIAGAAAATAAYGDIYTWKDARGTVFYTNSIHEIPARYLAKARVLDVATGKKGGLATAQPATTVAAAPGMTAAAPQPAATPPAAPAPAAQPPAPAAPAASPVVPPPVMPALRAGSTNRQAIEDQRRMHRRARARGSEQEE